MNDSSVILKFKFQENMKPIFFLILLKKCVFIGNLVRFIYRESFNGGVELLVYKKIII